MIENAEPIKNNVTCQSSIDSIISKAVNGDKDAFSQLIKDLENKLYRISRSVLKNDADCADAIQEALLRAWLKLPKLRNHQLFEHWLIRIVLRECYRIAKMRQFDNIDNSCASYKTNIDDKIAIQEAIYSLDTKKRVPFILHYIEGYKINEISHIMDIPEGTIKTRLMRARNEMREMLKEDK